MRLRRLKVFLSILLVITLVPSQINVISAKASDAVPSALAGSASPEIISVDNGLEDTWQLVSGQGSFEPVKESIDPSIRFVAGSKNDNAGNPALLGNDTLKAVSGGAIEFTVVPNSSKEDSRFGIFLNYKDKNNCIFVGYDSSSNWFYEYKVGGSGKWPSLNQTAPGAGEEVKVRIEYGSDNKMKVSLNGTETVIDTTPFSSLSEGEVLFKAGTYGTAITDVTLKDIKFNGMAMNAGDWKLKSTASGESATLAASEKVTGLRLTAADSDSNTYDSCTNAMDITAGEFKNGSFEAVLTPNAAYGGATTGMYLRYTDKEHFAFVGFDEVSGWFWEYKNGGGANDSYGYFDDKAGALPAVGQDIKLKVTASDGKLYLWINDGTCIDLSAEDGFDQSVFNSLTAGKIGFKAGKYERAVDVTVKSVSYIKMQETEEETPSEAYSYSNDFEAGHEDISTFKNIGTGSAAFERVEYGDGHALKVTIPSTGSNGAIIVDTATKKIANGYIEADIIPANGTSASKLSDIRAGMALRANTSTAARDLIYAGSGDSDGTWFYEHWNPKNSTNVWSSMYSGSPLSPGEKTHIKAKVLDGDISLWINDAKVISGTLGSGAQKDPGYFGFIKSRNSNTYLIDNIKIQEITAAKAPDTPADIDTIASDKLSVRIDKVFPRIIDYTWINGDSCQGEVFEGQEKSIYALKLNGVVVYPQVSCVINDKKDTAEYQLTAKDEENQIDAEITAQIHIEGNQAELTLTSVKNHSAENLKSIEIPDFNMITITSDQQNAQFKGAVISGDTTKSGDTTVALDKNYAVDASRGYAYGVLSSNKLSAAIWSNSEANGDARIIRNSASGYNDKLEEYKEISLTSAPWIWEYYPVTGQTQANVTKTVPTCKIIITPDINEDNIADWQDGAIAYREIMNNPAGWEDVADSVAYRISMNFASQATNPFLKTLDNVKKVYLATDGLGQAVLLKGYANEGHDSAHPDYGSVGERMGGEADLNTLLESGHNYNATFGVHINAQETYPEAKAFNEDLINGNPDGWDWLDPSYTIDRNYDLISGERMKRLTQLNDVTKGGLDFIYLDVWYGDSWESRRIAEQINSFGWRFSTEFGTAAEYDSTWQHWATDAAYGEASSKGINSELIRFIRNHQKDSWVLNYPSYEGTADNPLLGGLNLEGFEGWQGGYDFSKYIDVTFNVNLPTKFLQHYVVTNWTDVSGDMSKTNLEKEITLRSNAYDANADKVVVTRKDDGTRGRIITLNGTTVLDGEKYLLPWNFGALTDSSKDLPETAEKLYHWNEAGGTTTWQLIDSWKNCADVKVYALSDQGRSEATTVAVKDGTITLEAKPATAYVIYKGTVDKNTGVNWGEASHIVDPGFNSNCLNAWDIKGDTSAASVIKIDGNETLKIADAKEDTSLSQAITGLEPGKNYVALVSVDNRSASAGSLEVKSGKQVVSSYADTSFVHNYISADGHNNKTNQSKGGGSYMQTMQVSFTADSSVATLTLKRGKGDGITYFDDIRIVEKTLNNIVNKSIFSQDFESVVSGLYPFVLGPAQGITDPQTHLSELHAPYTQKGWNGRVLDDVISGNWSLKHHSVNTGIIYQTIPQNFRFEAGRQYRVEFDYETVLKGGYAFVQGIGTQTTDTSQVFEVSDVPKHFVTTITGDSTGQTWFGLYGKGGTDSGSVGQVDFVLDNLKITDITDGEPVENYRIDFNAEPASAKITVMKDNVTVEPDADGGYSLPEGDYTYTASASGYVSKEKVGFTVTKNDTINIKLERDNAQPTEQPTQQPTEQPTQQPTEQPTQQPTGQPTQQPAQPTEQPAQPTEQPTPPATPTPGAPNGSETGNSKGKITKDEINASKKNGTDIKVTVKDTSGKELYTWTFTGDSIKNSTLKTADVKLGIALSPANKEDKLKGIIKVSKAVESGVLLKLEQNGAFPASAAIKLYVGNQKGIKAGNPVYLYSFNEKTKKLEELPSVKYIVDKNGYISINLVHGDNYILLGDKPASKVITPLLEQISVKSSGSTLDKGKKAALNVTLPVTLEKVNSFKDKGYQKGVKPVTITYETSNSKIAVVSGTGTITGKKAGKVTITATVKLSNGTQKIFKSSINVK